MKSLKKTISYMLMLTALAIPFSSCSNDDDPDSGKGKETPAVNDIAGTYKGYSDGTCKYFSSQIGQDESVVITANADGTADLTYNTTTWSSTTIKNVVVKKDANGYSLTGSGKYSMGMGGSSSEYDCTLTGTISTDKQTYSVAFNLPAVMGGLTITFQNGEAPAAKVIAGSYDGWAKFAFKYSATPLVYVSEEAAITANEDGTVSIAYTSSELGKGTFSNVTVEKDGTGYKLTGNGTFNMGMSGSTAKDYDCELAGTISSDKETVSLVLTLPSVMGGSTITFSTSDAPVAYVVAGDYTGSVNIAINGAELKNLTAQTMTLEATDDETVSINYTCNDEELAQFGVGSMEFKGLKAAKNDDGSYKVSGTSTYSLMGTELPCTIDGSISSDKKTFTINVDVNGGEDIQVKVVFKNAETSAE